MDKWVKATARHGHNLSVYLATSAAPSAPGVLMTQEIFGVTLEFGDFSGRFAAEQAQRIRFLAANLRWQGSEVVA